MPSPTQAQPELSKLQSSILEAIALGASYSSIARAVGIHRSTIYNWLRTQPAFAEAAAHAHADYAEELRDQLRDLAGLALSRLRALLENPDTPPAVQLKAALAILNRPHFPQPGWHLPERVESPAEQQTMDELASMHAEDDRIRMSEKLARHAEPEPAAQDAPAVPRNAPCPCGSGQKFKRCCGRSAPPQYSNAA